MTWSKNFECCTKCGTTEKKHKGHGLCALCHWKNRYHTNPAFATRVKANASRYYVEHAETTYQRISDWRKANPKKCKRYSKRHRIKRRKALGVGHSAKWFKGVLVRFKIGGASIFGVVQDKAFREDGEFVVPVQIEGATETMELPVKGLERMGLA